MQKKQRKKLQTKEIIVISNFKILIENKKQGKDNNY